jgi:hypothetical protein
LADELDRFLEAALAPTERLPDCRFVARVQAGIAIEQQLAAHRQALGGSLLKQLAALLAVAAAMWLIGRAPRIAEWSAQSPELTMLIVLAGFVPVVALIGLRPADEVRSSALF